MRPAAVLTTLAFVGGAVFMVAQRPASDGALHRQTYAPGGGGTGDAAFEVASVLLRPMTDAVLRATPKVSFGWRRSWNEVPRYLREEPAVVKPEPRRTLRPENDRMLPPPPEHAFLKPAAAPIAQAPVPAQSGPAAEAKGRPKAAKTLLGVLGAGEQPRRAEPSNPANPFPPHRREASAAAATMEEAPVARRELYGSHGGERRAASSNSTVMSGRARVRVGYQQSPEPGGDGVQDSMDLVRSESETSQDALPGAIGATAGRIEGAGLSTGAKNAAATKQKTKYGLPSIPDVGHGIPAEPQFIGTGGDKKP
ncbi:MAG: hypothetical protein HY078_01325 [Elusimicrobia bacterium]|nr:hypothetical protein [Elusimicrobiota bacterium]